MAGSRSAFSRRDDDGFSRAPSLAEQLEGTIFDPKPDWPERPTVTSAEQRSVPLEGSIDEDYEKWMTEGGGESIYKRIRSAALKMYHAGAPKIGVKALIERDRWENKAHINNKFTSRIARDLIAEHPFLAKLIELRQLNSSQGVSE